MEFDDVFLFNFFADSPADERTWRVITGTWQKQQAAAKEAEAREAAGRPPSALPADRTVRASEGEEGRECGDDEKELTIDAPRPEAFDRQRHSLLNEELKMLYTAITRARVKVVIYDVAEEKRRPIFHFLLSKRLAKIFDSNQVGAPSDDAQTSPSSHRPPYHNPSVLTSPLLSFPVSLPALLSYSLFSPQADDPRPCSLLDQRGVGAASSQPHAPAALPDRCSLLPAGQRHAGHARGARHALLSQPQLGRSRWPAC